MQRSERQVWTARALADELEAEHGDAADVARVLVLALEHPEVLRTRYASKPSLLLRRVWRALDRYPQRT